MKTLEVRLGVVEPLAPAGNVSGRLTCDRWLGQWVGGGSEWDPLWNPSMVMAG